MSSSPRVSVVTIFLDEERFLAEAIESVLAQSFTDWELLLVDDGSTDGSARIARDYARSHSVRIRTTSHLLRRNRGMSASRNRGVRLARGEFVTFLDADDVWLPGKLASQVEALAAHPEAAALCAPAEWWYSWSGRAEDGGRDFVQRWSVPRDCVVSPPDLLEMFLEDEWASLCDLLVRRSAFATLGGYEAAFRGMYEDQVFHAKLCFRFPIYAASRCGYRYRQHEGACTSRSHASGETEAARRRYFHWLDSWLAERGAATTPLAQRVAARLAALPPPAAAAESPRVDFGSLRRLEPVSRHYGFDRGQPVDRHYIERFLARHAEDIRGRVLEIGDDAYTRRFGGEAVSRRDVLHVRPGHPQATFVDDLARGATLPSDAFDCIVLTQTLQLVYDLGAAVRTLHRILAPGGVVLATVPGITQQSADEWNSTWYWSFTTLSARRLFAEAFTAHEIEVVAHGNVLAAIAFLEGLIATDLTAEELAHSDPLYELLITVRARKGSVARGDATPATRHE